MSRNKHRLPGKYVNYYGLKQPVSCLAAIKEDGAYGVMVLKLSGNRWTVVDTANAIVGLSGIVGGYSLTAVTVAPLLARLGIWTVEESNAFVAWYWATDRARQEADELEKTQGLARKHGYVLVKKPDKEQV